MVNKCTTCFSINDGDSSYLQNICEFLPDYKASWLRIILKPIAIRTSKLAMDSLLKPGLILVQFNTNLNRNYMQQRLNK